MLRGNDWDSELSKQVQKSWPNVWTKLRPDNKHDFTSNLSNALDLLNAIHAEGTGLISLYNASPSNLPAKKEIFWTVHNRDGNTHIANGYADNEAVAICKAIAALIAEHSIKIGTPGRT